MIEGVADSLCLRLDGLHRAILHRIQRCCQIPIHLFVNGLGHTFVRHGKDLRANSRTEATAYTTSIYNIAHRLILLFLVLMAFRLQPQYSQLSPIRMLL